MEVTVTHWTLDRAFEFKHTIKGKKSFAARIADIELGASVWLHERLLNEKLGFAVGCDLIKLAHCMGGKSNLQIGELKGTIMPGESSEGWLYPSGVAAEDEWFWQWCPDKDSVSLLNADLDQTGPLLGNQLYLKSLVAYRLASTRYKFRENAFLALSRLPDLFKPGTPFIFSN